MRSGVARSIFIYACLLSTQASWAQFGSQEAAAELQFPHFNAIGFGDVSYLSSDGTSRDGFAIGQAVAHLSASLDPSFSVFGEFSLTAREDEYSSEVERLIVKYDFSDTFKLSAGRYHSPIGFWNSAFHHGSWLQTTVSRPEYVKFGSKIVPIHFVGALLEGRLPSNALGLSYMVGFGNGRHANVARAGDAGDINSDNAWMVQINAAPDRYYGLKTGIGFYTDRISPDDRPDIDESTFSAYLAWDRESPEVLIEYLRSHHEFSSAAGADGDTSAWYVQLAYRLKGARREWAPYLRVEHTDVDDTDPLLGDQMLDYDAGIVGVRWDFSDFAALKAEYRNEEFDNAGRENNFRVQVSFVLTKL